MSNFKPDKHDIEELNKVRIEFFKKNMPYVSVERDDFIYDSGFVAGCEWLLKRFLDKSISNIKSVCFDRESKTVGEMYG